MSKLTSWVPIVLFCVMLASLYLVTKSVIELKKENQSLTEQLSQQVEINNKYQSRIAKLNELDTKHTTELTNAKAEIDRLRISAERNPERVYIKAECPTSDSGTPSSLDVSRPTPVARDTEENILNLMEQIETLERQYLGLRDYYFTECKR